jgi:hypothetical protein
MSARRRLVKLRTPGLLLVLIAAAVANPARAQELWTGPPPAPVLTAGDLEKLKGQLEAQREQLRKLQAEIERQQELIDVAIGNVANHRPADSPITGTRAAVASFAVPAAALHPRDAVSAPPVASNASGEGSPLSFGIGMANITPVGFLDFTTVTRSSAPGSGVGTNFGGIPFSNTAQGELTETRFSAQNSRIGLRLDTKFRETKVLGYLEADFLGFVPTNAAVTSNSDSLRLRLYFADLRRGKVEILGGQSWSMLTPGRTGISPLPGDLFYSQNIDVNYQVGLVWSRDPQFRVVYHPHERIAMGVSLEASEQYIGGSAGGGTVVLPSALVTPYNNQLNNGGTTLSVPSVRPDVVAKIAFDPSLNGHHVHFELAGVERTFRTFNTITGRHFSKDGAGAQANLVADLTRNFRLVSADYWSDGGGRWIFGQAPDLVVRGDGSISPVHSGSVIQGLEIQVRKTLLSAYYGGIYIGRNVAIDPSSKSPVGYGYSGSGSGQNRTIQEITFDLNQTLWKDARYGAVNLMFQYSYLMRSPWFVAASAPKSASENMAFFNLRYTLPGSAPVIK